jgi:hypothetical protein
VFDVEGLGSCLACTVCERHALGPYIILQHVAADCVGELGHISVWPHYPASVVYLWCRRINNLHKRAICVDARGALARLLLLGTPMTGAALCRGNIVLQLCNRRMPQKHEAGGMT